ncbi:potassium channel family protein [Falsiroseomonas ponticola]|uniref:potassium channel family protein n=1 Tax=Falsiroseomonas ponticola TaxID=2786951 RepID=UPI001931FE5B|nr:potassium channel family protein [Roseomonas ponticola]
MNPLPPHRLRQAWARSVAFTVALSLLVALGVGDEGLVLSAVVLGVAGLGLGLLYRLFPRGLHFAFGTATGLALYATLFVVLGRAQFPHAADWSRPIAFLLPVLAFLGTVFWRRRELAEVAEKQEAESLDLLPYAARWLAGVSAVGVICFALPVNRLAPEWQAAILMAAMAVIGGVVALSVRDVVRLLVDVALIMEELGNRARHLAVPIVAFLLMYAVLVIGFGATYRIADGLSHHALFHGPEGPIRLSYSDALHFSIATLSTVGYGDIRPSDDGARVLASLEVLAGQLLLLFGFAEIMRSRRVRAEGPAGRSRVRDPHVDPDGAAGHSPPPHRHGGD